MSLVPNIEFYDRLLMKYNPELIAAIYDGENFDSYKIVAIILFKLEQKGNIKIKDNGIVVSNPLKYGLSEVECYILDMINNGCVRISDNNKLKYLILEEGKKHDILVAKRAKLLNKNSKLLKLFWAIPITSLVASLINPIFGTLVENICTYFVFMELVCMTSTAKLIAEPLADINFTRTGFGNDIYKKLMELKKCIFENDGYLNAWNNLELYKLLLSIEWKQISRVYKFIGVGNEEVRLFNDYYIPKNK